MKWIFILFCVVIVGDLVMHDPLRLRYIDFNELRQTVRNFSDHLTQSEYREVVDSKLPKH